MFVVELPDLFKVKKYYNTGIYYGALICSPYYRPEIFIKMTEMSEWQAFDHLRFVRNFLNRIKAEGNCNEWILPANTDGSLVRNFYQPACSAIAGIKDLVFMFRRRSAESLDFGDKWLEEKFTNDEQILIKKDYELFLEEVKETVFWHFE